jgi:hypothetical protein
LSSAKVEAVCDNQGAITKCSSAKFHHIKNHRDINADLFLTQQDTQKSIPIRLSWKKSHSDKKPWKSLQDLTDQCLSRDEIYNIWCDYMVGNAWDKYTPVDDPDVTPAERWALYSVYPTYHKITGNLNTEIYSSLGFVELSNFIVTKHKIPKGALESCDCPSLQRYLGSLKPQSRSALEKLIHGWQTAYSSLCRQARENNPICPRCHSTVETCALIIECPQVDAMRFRQDQ